VRVCVCVCVCERERERERENLDKTYLYSLGIRLSKFVDKAIKYKLIIFNLFYRGKKKYIIYQQKVRNLIFFKFINEY
jgi:hypothetical protein